MEYGIATKDDQPMVTEKLSTSQGMLTSRAVLSVTLTRKYENNNLKEIQKKHFKNRKFC